MNKVIIDIVDKWGYYGVFWLLIIETIFPPIPSEIILTFSGFLTTVTSLNIYITIIVSTIASLISAYILYFIGSLFNINKIKILINKKPFSYMNIKNEQIDKSLLWFDNKGQWSVLICRFIPVVRSLISLPAGIKKMSFIKFTILTTLGSFIWNTILIISGKLFSDIYPLLVYYINKTNRIILLVFILIMLLYWRFKKKIHMLSKKHVYK